MGAALDDAPRIEDQDRLERGHLDEPMGDDEERTSGRGRARW